MTRLTFTFTRARHNVYNYHHSRSVSRSRRWKLAIVHSLTNMSTADSNAYLKSIIC